MRGDFGQLRPLFVRVVIFGCEAFIKYRPGVRAADTSGENPEGALGNQRCRPCRPQLPRYVEYPNGLSSNGTW